MSSENAKVGDVVVLMHDLAWGCCHGTVMSADIGEDGVLESEILWATPEGEVLTIRRPLTFDNLLMRKEDFDHRFDHLNAEQRLVLAHADITMVPEGWSRKALKRVHYSFQKLGFLSSINGKAVLSKEGQAAQKFVWGV